MARPTKIETMMEVARIVSRRSTCSRLSVGAVLTDLRMEQLWYGYNGGAMGGANECRHGPDSPGGCGCLHAETNAVIKAPGDIAKLAFLTHSPCALCATMLVNAHVAEVYYDDEYRDIEGLAILADAGIRTQRRGDGTVGTTWIPRPRREVPLDDWPVPTAFPPPCR